MSDVAIKVEDLGKMYRIGHQASGSISEKFRGLFSWRQKKEIEEFWALQNVSFEIKQGEAIGIIGRNGAGKSTLLKILSRITHPTTGRFEMKGRVSSLLEVGTGFHPELSGRENIFLNGTILGMTRNEIKNKFDEIVAFSGVEKFLDTPVKHYSSGMYVRLAFSVAAHLEPEILIIDEVLAVGDVEFQKKCFGKMGEVSQQGRTVLFVSHNMHALELLCPQSLLLKNGSLVDFSTTPEILSKYLVKEEMMEIKEQNWSDGLRDGPFRLFQTSINLRAGTVLQVAYELMEGVESLDFSFHIFNEKEILVAVVSTIFIKNKVPSTPGQHQVRIVVPNLDLVPGNYRVTFRAIRNKASRAFLRLDHLLSFNVKSNLIDSTYIKVEGIVQPKYFLEVL